jgi:ribose transport system substrate-binding protein
MPRDYDDRDDGVSRRHACKWMIWTGTALCCTVSEISNSSNLLGAAIAAPAVAQTRATIPIIVKDTTSFYWRVVLAGARKAGQDLGADIVELGAQSESDIDGQIRLLESALASNPAALVIAPAQFAALGKPIDKAAQKVKIITIDSEVDSKAVTSVVKTDDVQIGRIAADSLATAIKRSYADTEGDVALIMPPPGIPAFDQRVRGFKEQVAAKYGALALVAEMAVDPQPATGFKVMTDLIGAHPELRGVFASNLLLAQGSCQALAGNKTNKTGDKINLVGCEWDENLLKFLQDGTIAALVVQDPFRMGYDGIKTALAAAKGQQVPANIDSGANLITKANMNSPRSQELLNPKIK